MWSLDWPQALTESLLSSKSESKSESNPVLYMKRKQTKMRWGKMLLIDARERNQNSTSSPSLSPIRRSASRWVVTCSKSDNTKSNFSSLSTLSHLSNEYQTKISPSCPLVLSSASRPHSAPVVISWISRLASNVIMWWEQTVSQILGSQQIILMTTYVSTLSELFLLASAPL